LGAAIDFWERQLTLKSAGLERLGSSDDATMLLRLTVISGFFVILFGCGGSAKEASAEFDSAKLGTLLDAIRPHIAKGFSEQQAREIENGFQSLAVDATRQYTYPIVYDGSETELLVEVRKEDVDVVEIRFRGPPELADQIQQTIATTPLD
jgi:hypothetical protein